MRSRNPPCWLFCPNRLLSCRLPSILFLLSGSRGALLLPRPLGTVHESFPLIRLEPSRTPLAGRGFRNYQPGAVDLAMTIRMQ